MEESQPMRKIIHVDMDAFYASVEQRDHPSLRGKAIAIGYSGGRGVVMTCSYEARKFGVRSAMPSSTAARLCPNLIFVRPRMDVYKETSRAIREVFHGFTDLVEPLSLDEAYLDVTNNKPGYTSAIYMARLIKDQILEKTRLTSSAGVSYNKFLAKIASDFRKPNGLNFIGPESAEHFLEGLSVSKFHGIGRKTAEKMAAMQIQTGKDLKEKSRQELITHFGKAGQFYYDIVRGTDNREVKPNRPLKSVSIEDTFAEDSQDMAFLISRLNDLSAQLFVRLEKKNNFGKTVTLKVKYGDFNQITRSKTVDYPVTNPDYCSEIVRELLHKTEAGTRPIRLVGIGVSNFGEDNEPESEDSSVLTLF